MSEEVVERELEEIEAQLAKVQEQIRQATQRRVELIQQEEAEQLAEFDADLSALRSQRQSLLDQQLRLQRQSREELPPASSPTPPVSVPPRSKIQGAQGQPPLAVRVATAMLVFGGVAAVVVGILFYVYDQFFVPPPIEDLMASEEPPSFDVTTPLGIYLTLHRDTIAQAPSDDPTPVNFVVEPGETALTIAQRLEEEGLVTDEEVFRRLLQYRGADQLLEAGVYQLARNMKMDEIILTLQHGKEEEITFTIPEGWRAEQIAQHLESLGLLISAEEYMLLVREPSRFNYPFLQDLPPDSTLEGYLFPDTYSVFKEEATAESIIRMQLDTFEQRVTPELRAEVTAREITLHEAIILASIVEREAVIPEEREVIAGVYINRLEDGTLLNADPTIQYALGLDPESGAWWRRLSLEDLQLDSPYNTYTRPGLPPGPISNPGLATLEATIRAPETEFYYFVARNDGSHVFARTLEEHIQNVQEYQSGE